MIGVENPYLENLSGVGQLTQSVPSGLNRSLLSV